MRIDLLNLEVEVDHVYHGPQIGGSHPHGGTEEIPPMVEIISVKCNGIEIINVVPNDQLRSMEQEILENEYA